MMKNKNRHRAVIKGKIRFSLSHFFIFSFFILLAACSDYESFSDNPNFRLSFSADTIAFDTLISTIPSSTKTLYAFNKNNDGIRISTIRLEGGASSHFRVNVDGRYLAGGAWNDFEVLGGDSLVVRIEMTPPEVGSNEPLYFTDKLHFFLENGAQQTVVLSGGALDAYIKKGGLIIESDETLLTDKPYVIYDSLVVAPGVTLTLPQGCTLMFHDQTSLLVHGTLKANGTLAQPVTLRGDRTDRMFPYLPYDNTPNRWGGVHFFADSKNNELTQCDIHSGDYGIICDSTALTEDSDPLLLMEDCIVHNIGGPGLVFTHCRTQVTGTQISNTLGRCVDIEGGAHVFVHCTIAQFYPLSASRDDALYMADMEGEDIYRPLLWCYFVNCVITGYADDVVMGNLAENTFDDVDLLFQNSLLRTVVSDDSRFVDIRYDLPDSLEVTGKDHFVLFDTDNFLYDFAPDSLSAIRGLADSEYSKLFPIDRRGVSRLADGEPDAGAYEGK